MKNKWKSKWYQSQSNNQTMPKKPHNTSLSLEELSNQSCTQMKSLPSRSYLLYCQYACPVLLLSPLLLLLFFEGFLSWNCETKLLLLTAFYVHLACHTVVLVWLNNYKDFYQDTEEEELQGCHSWPGVACSEIVRPQIERLPPKAEITQLYNPLPFKLISLFNLDIALLRTRERVSLLKLTNGLKHEG